MSYRGPLRLWNLKVYTINEIIIQSQTNILEKVKLTSCSRRQNKVYRALFEARKVAGSAKCKQSERV